MRLFVTRSVRRYVGLASLLFFTVPFGLSVIGCGHKAAPPVYCNTNANSGPVVGQVAVITLASNLSVTGQSVNYGQIAPSLSATAQDCKSNSVTVSKYVYATTDMSFADVNPNTGSVCGGSWNRNSGSGIPDFTICTAPATAPSNHVAFITAEAEGVSSNPIAVYVHPVVTGVQLSVAQSENNACSSTDPTSDCCPNSISGSPTPAPGYDGTSCVSQNNRVQLAAKVYANGKTDPADNITCQVGHLGFTAQGAASVVTIDANGFATANQPGSSTITATISNSSTASNAGFFSTCPPANIVLTAVGQGNQNPINVGLNNSQPLTATVYDGNIDATHPNGHQITGISLQYNSTTPQTISAASGSILPSFPGSADITAVCQPGSCNPSPLSQIGFLGNGKPLTSNSITVNTAGSSGELIYMGSTSSQYVVAFDSTQKQQVSPIRLPFVPNSMVMTQDGTTIYFGSDSGLMTLTTSGNSVSAANQTIPGVVLAVSPDGTTAVVTDRTRQTISLVSNGVVTTSYGNLIGTSAAWSPDSQTVYITTNTNTLLTHSAFNNWQVSSTDAPYVNVAVMVPHVGAYFAAGTSGTDGRTFCSTTTIVTPGSNGNPPTTANQYYPVADPSKVANQILAATTDGKHILGANLPNGSATAVLNDLILPSPLPAEATACTISTAPVTFSSSANPPLSLSQITVTPQDIPGLPSTISGISQQGITGIDPATNSAIAFVTYNGSSGLLPQYVPSTGTLSYLKLGNGSTTATAPLSGVFSTDNLTFYVGDSDGIVHLFSISGTTATETSILSPALPNATTTGNPNAAPVNLIAQHPKRLQS